MNTKLPAILLWIARLWCGLLLVFLLFFIGAHLYEDGVTSYFNNERDLTTFLFFPALTVIALILSFKWKMLGAILLIISITGLLVLRSDLITHFELIFFIITPAILLILSQRLIIKGVQTA